MKISVIEKALAAQIVQAEVALRGIQIAMDEAVDAVDLQAISKVTEHYHTCEKNLKGLRFRLAALQSQWEGEKELLVTQRLVRRLRSCGKAPGICRILEASMQRVAILLSEGRTNAVAHALKCRLGG